MIDAATLRRMLNYEMFGGVFTWATSPSAKFQIGQLAGSVTPRGYLQIGLFGKNYPAHRLAWLHVYDRWPQGVIDHIDGNPLNNSIMNLRDVSQQMNTRNAKVSKNSRSGVNGVNWNSKRRCWNAFIMVDRKSINLGYFSTVEAAAQTRRRYEMELGFISRAT